MDGQDLWLGCPPPGNSWLGSLQGFTVHGGSDYLLLSVVCLKTAGSHSASGGRGPRHLSSSRKRG
eukprot:12410078-Karenia_brevis.AAC.1